MFFMPGRGKQKWTHRICCKTFKADDLGSSGSHQVVMLNSGGPLMDVEAVEDGPDGQRYVVRGTEAARSFLLRCVWLVR